LADEDDEKKADEANEGEKDKKKKKKKKKNKNKKKKSKRDSEEETVSKDAVESEEPNPADIAEDKREDEEINGVLRYKYLIVGGGTASYAAVKAIRDADPEAEVSLRSSYLLIAHAKEIRRYDAQSRTNSSALRFCLSHPTNVLLTNDLLFPKNCGGPKTQTWHKTSSLLIGWATPPSK
jgi:hypothetical protein